MEFSLFRSVRLKCCCFLYAGLNGVQIHLLLQNCYYLWQLQYPKRCVPGLKLGCTRKALGSKDYWTSMHIIAFSCVKFSHHFQCRTGLTCFSGCMWDGERNNDTRQRWLKVHQERKLGLNQPQLKLKAVMLMATCLGRREHTELCGNLLLIPKVFVR